MNVITKTGGDLVEKRTAVFSPCEKYRYTLEIVWDASKPLCQFIGLNPSTANEMQDDPTLRRCKGFARSWGFGGIVMTNLFAWRDTDPRGMKKQSDPVGPLNCHYLFETWKKCDRVICAWGNHGMHLEQATIVRGILRGAKLECFRLTRSNQPEHPLYMPASIQPIPLN